VVHKRVHAELTVQVQALMREYASEGPEICVRLKEFLGEWLLKHIKGMDKRVGEFLTRQGVR
jgi:hemerythrin